MVNQTAYLLGIAGPSGSGKSTLAREVYKRLGSKQSLLLSMDSYYRDLSHLDKRQRDGVNFDHPEAIEHELLVKDLQTLKAGNGVNVPNYDFNEHIRLKAQTRLEPMQVLILEGLFTLAFTSLRPLLDLSVFVELPDEECLARRVRRDQRERGRSLASVKEQYEQTVRPMC